MEEQALEKYVDYVEGFDQKGIQIVFQFVCQNAGTLLLESLVNGHENVLNIPTALSSYNYFCEFEDILIHNSLDKAVENFIKSDFFSSGHLWGNRTPEENLTKEFQANFGDILLDILKKVSQIDSKKFFLSVCFAYAHIKNIDISKVKVIFQHNHEFPVKYSFENYSLEVLYPFKALKRDFPSLKVVINIRNFIDCFFSCFNAVINRDKLFSILSQDFLESFYKGFFRGYAIVILKNTLKENLKFVKFEEIHLNTEKTMRELSDFMGIEYSISMLESSYEGRLWYWDGYDKNDRKHGTNPVYDLNKWKSKFPDCESKVLLKSLFNALNRHFGYEEYNEIVNERDLYKLTMFDRTLFLGHLLNKCIGNYQDFKSQYSYNSSFSVVFFIFMHSLKKIFIERKFLYSFNFFILGKCIKYYFEYKHKRKNVIKKLILMAKQLDNSNSIEEFANLLMVDNIFEKNFLIKTNFKKHLNKLTKKLKNKRVLIYGDSKLFNTICREYDLSGLHIIGVCDRKYEQQNYSQPTHPYAAIAPSKAYECDVDVILISILNNINNNLITYVQEDLLKNTETKVMFLYKKTIMDLVKCF